MFLRRLQETSRTLLLSAKLTRCATPQAQSNPWILFNKGALDIFQTHQQASKRYLTLLGTTIADVISDNKDCILPASNDFQPQAPTRQRNPITTNQKRSIKMTFQTELPKKFNMEWPKITLFGDSITRRSMDPDNGCWASMISHAVGSYFDVDVRGFEGYNSRWGLELMPKLFPKSYLDKVELFVPFFGHNDSWDADVPLHVPVEEYESNMREIVKYLVENGLEKSKIIMITPTWYHRETCSKWLKENGIPPFTKDLANSKKYSDAILRIAQDMGIEVVDFFDTSCKHEPLDEMFCDGIHYSRLGAKMLFESLMPVIESKLEASFKKPLAEMWHVIPLEQRPDIKSALEAHQKSLRAQRNE